MTDKETIKRIEEDADEYCKQYLPHVNTTGHWIGFQDGAKSERNKAIDEVAAKLNPLVEFGFVDVPWTEVTKILESLKL